MVLTRTIDSLSQVPHTLLNRLPLVGCPVLKGCLCSDVIPDSIFHRRFGSFTLNLFVEDLLEVCPLSSGAKFEPLSSALPVAFASSSILYPLHDSPPLQLAYSELLRERIGLTVLHKSDVQLRRVSSVFRQEFCSSTDPLCPESADLLTFWLGCISPISPHN